MSAATPQAPSTPPHVHAHILALLGAMEETAASCPRLLAGSEPMTVRSAAVAHQHVLDVHWQFLRQAQLNWNPARWAATLASVAAPGAASTAFCLGVHCVSRTVAAVPTGAIAQFAPPSPHSGSEAWAAHQICNQESKTTRSIRPRSQQGTNGQYKQQGKSTFLHAASQLRQYTVRLHGIAQLSTISNASAHTKPATASRHCARIG